MINILFDFTSNLKVAEYKVEIMCTKEQIKDAVFALRQAYPYETAAYQVVRVESF